LERQVKSFDKTGELWYSYKDVRDEMRISTYPLAYRK